jgi:hypothetical protein
MSQYVGNELHMRPVNGGPAFPATRIISINGTIAGEAVLDGMTLRDWFAGQALAGMLANSSYDEETFETTAEMSYMQADAMLAARPK